MTPKPVMLSLTETEEIAMCEPKWFVVFRDEGGDWETDGQEGFESEEKALHAAELGAGSSGLIHLVVRATKRVGPKESPVVTTEVK